MTTSAEARGRARQWLADAARRHAALGAVLADPALKHQAGALLRRRDRARARIALRRMLDPHAVFVGCIERPQLLVWRALAPSPPIHAAPANGSDAQGCVLVLAICAGELRRLPGGRVTLGCSLWALAVQDHALARLIERDPGGDPAAVILAAHDTVVAGRREAALAEHARLLMPAGRGAFLGRVMRATWRGEDAGLLAVCDTWISVAMLHADQRTRLLAPAGNPADALGRDMLPLSLIRTGDLPCRL